MAYLIRHLGMTVSAAHKLVVTKRPKVSNMEFHESLRHYEKSLKMPAPAPAKKK